MNRTYKLHELIEMAESGLKFTARPLPDKYSNEYHFEYTEKEVLNSSSWDTLRVMHNYTVTFKREPRILWVAELPDDNLSALNKLTKDDAAIYGKPIKFIEVLEE